MAAANTKRTPVAFIGHGSPMNTLERNTHTEAWRAFGASIGKPRAVLCISAHWSVTGIAVTAMANPETIHDFRGFPRALNEFIYPAPGDPELARRIAELFQPAAVTLDERWGLDHGAWSVLAHVFPTADVPVVQLGIDLAQAPSVHYRIGKHLAPLRDEGVLILASGNVVHNLGMVRFGAGQPAYDWAQRFEDLVIKHVLAREHAPVIDYAALGDDSRLSIPTAEHYLPLLYVLGALADAEQPRVLTRGIELGSIGMFAFAA